MSSISNSEEIVGQKADTDKTLNKNFFLTLINGIFASVGFRLVDSSMVLSAFVKELTKSNIMVGLVSATMSAGFMWPQLLMSNMLEHKLYKMPFYTIGITIRIIAWILIPILTLFIGNGHYHILFLCFYILYFIACSSLGISSIPFSDIVAKAIPSQRRARLFSLRQLIGEILGIGTGFLIRYILSDKFSLSFPYNYSFIFGLSVLMMIIASGAFIMVKEPIHPVNGSKRPFWEHFKRGPYFLKNDKNYRNYLIFRIISSFGSMCIPFYVIFALDRINVDRSAIGIFTAVGATSAVISNIIWGYIGDRKGSQSLIMASSVLACITPFIAISTNYIPSFLQQKYYLLVFIINQAFLSGIGIANITYTLDLAPSKSRPTYLGFINTMMFPISFVPMLAGFLIKIISYETMFLISAGISAIAVYFASKLTNDPDHYDSILEND